MCVKCDQDKAKKAAADRQRQAQRAKALVPRKPATKPGAAKPGAAKPGTPKPGAAKPPTSAPPASPQNVPHPTPAPAPSTPLPRKPVAQMSLVEKLQAAALAGAEEVGGVLGARIRELVTPWSIGLMLVLFGVSGALAGTGVGLVVEYGLLCALAVYVGWESGAAVRQFADYLEIASTAQDEDDLKRAGKCLAEAVVSSAGVALAFFTRPKLDAARFEWHPPAGNPRLAPVAIGAGGQTIHVPVRPPPGVADHVALAKGKPKGKPNAPAAAAAAAPASPVFETRAAARAEAMRRAGVPAGAKPIDAWEVVKDPAWKFPHHYQKGLRAEDLAKLPDGSVRHEKLFFDPDGTGSHVGHYEVFHDAKGALVIIVEHTADAEAAARMPGAPRHFHAGRVPPGEVAPGEYDFRQFRYDAVQVDEDHHIHYKH